MKSHHLLQSLFVVGLAVQAAAGAVYSYALWQVLLGTVTYPGGAVLLNSAYIARDVAALITIIPIIVGLYLVLSRPRPYGVRPPLAGFTVAVVGACITAGLVAFPPMGGFTNNPGIGIIGFGIYLIAGAVAAPLFVLGLGMMTLWDPVLRTDSVPVFYPPPSPETMK